jgi:hypothetical protein
MRLADRCSEFRHRQTNTPKGWTEDEIAQAILKIRPLTNSLDDLDLDLPILVEFRNALHEIGDLR